MTQGKVAKLLNSFGVLLAGMIAVFLQSGSFKAFGVLFDDIVEEYKTSYMYAGWVLTFKDSVSFIVAGIVGALLGGLQNKTLGVSGGFLFGLGFVLIGLLCRTSFQLFLFTGVTAVGEGLLYFSLYMSFLEHFDAETFPTAYSVRELFTYLGIVVIPILVDNFRRRYGLFGSYLLMGAVSWNTVLSGLLMKPKKGIAKIPGNKQKKEDAQTTNQEDDSNSIDNSREKSKHTHVELCSGALFYEHPQFVPFVVIQAFFSLTFATWAIFLVPFGRSKGFPSEVAVLLSAIGGVGGFLGKIVVLVVFWYNRMNTIAAIVVPAITCASSFSGYLVSHTFWGLALSSFCCGFTLAYADGALGGTVPDHLCERHIRQGMAVLFVCNGLAMQLGGIISETCKLLWHRRGKELP
ncbi:uncharacterized protein [Apostichopus japonicus]|uniref:uncharacterized protein isoform X2 n=1 Tax=Stichopus japonicus TaxID=307972 RepID=UPI003AB2EBCB